eukprot:CAMPEP_0181203588 /NCGR_PEP_ID=MMETSP1096-20121128/19471_1 /TAXON_ID=156174 ORGANISM="Chrysochromulina ericina, Strain CCMP281" /NCGR_SAMPLE_ID=MMETSP1096 /ASSEMBLY_ACC=CAM_ASM_000453 /LENGTH=193 /DNA_ID=CAMNT_0023294209 /DNA_START=51 /DNA_END=632 /DNA_ORIENTATION=-
MGCGGSKPAASDPVSGTPASVKKEEQAPAPGPAAPAPKSIEDQQAETSAVLQNSAADYLAKKRAAAEEKKQKEQELDAAAGLLQAAAANHLEIKRVEDQKKVDEAPKEPGLLEAVGTFMSGLFSKRDNAPDDKPAEAKPAAPETITEEPAAAPTPAAAAPAPAAPAPAAPAPAPAAGPPAPAAAAPAPAPAAA